MTKTPDEINSQYPDPVYRCRGCHVGSGLHWYRDTSCPVCSKPECIAQVDAEWAAALAGGTDSEG